MSAERQQQIEAALDEPQYGAMIRAGLEPVTRDDVLWLLARLSELQDTLAALEAVLMDANVTYGITDDEGGATPMMVERQAIVRALGYADESAWLARTAEINAERRTALALNADGPRENFIGGAAYIPAALNTDGEEEDDNA